jgi:hypothetical protein
MAMAAGRHKGGPVIPCYGNQHKQRQHRISFPRHHVVRFPNSSCFSRFQSGMTILKIRMNWSKDNPRLSQ